MITLSRDDWFRLRLAAQGLAAPLGGPTDVVEALHAVQAQDARAARSAIALRTGAGDTPAGRDDVAAAFDDGSIVRSWPMRGTLFASTPDALATLLSLTAQRIGAELARRRTRLGIADDTMDRARAVAADAVVNGGSISRAALMQAWNDVGVSTDDGLGYHMIVQLAIDGVVVWGPTDGADHLLVSGGVPVAPDDPSEALAQVVVGYLRGHGPATVDDIAWWTKLPKGWIRRGVAAAGERAVEVEVGLRAQLVTADALDALADLAPLDDRVWLLPAFDEWYLGYQDRADLAPPGAMDVIVPGRNGMFRPIVLAGTEVVATWRRSGDGAELVDTLRDLTPAEHRRVDAAFEEWTAAQT